MVHRLTGTELLRQSIHIATGFLALALRWVDPLVLVPVAVTGIIFNAWILPRFGSRYVWRPSERLSGGSIGVVAYPVGVLALLLLYHSVPEVAAAGWGLLAFGDGAATVIGSSFGRQHLPWNTAKSWAGSVAFWIVGSLAVGGLIAWTAPAKYGGALIAGAAIATGLLGAAIESSKQRLDDNLTVPLVSSLFLLCMLSSGGGWGQLTESDFLRWAAAAAAINLAFAYGGMWLGGLNRSGAIAAWLLGTVILSCLGWAGYLCLLTFFFIGTATTRLGGDQKKRQRTAQEQGGRRRAANALANGGVAGLCALFAVVTPFPQMFTLAFVTSVAAACADTVESEIGQLWGRPTLLITTMSGVEPGTNGGVSLLGTVAGLLGALSIAAGGSWAGILSAHLILPLSVLAVAATLLESVVGATLERAGLLDNAGVNFFNTLVAALIGAGLWLVVF